MAKQSSTPTEILSFTEKPMLKPELYQRYGELMIQAEILQAQISQLKQAIANVLNEERASAAK